MHTQLSGIAAQFKDNIKNPKTKDTLSNLAAQVLLTRHSGDFADNWPTKLDFGKVNKI